MTRRIQRSLSVPIKSAMMLAMAALAQSGMPEPSGSLRTEMGIEHLVRLGRGPSSLRPRLRSQIPLLRNRREADFTMRSCFTAVSLAG